MRQKIMTKHVVTFRMSARCSLQDVMQQQKTLHSLADVHQYVVMPGTHASSYDEPMLDSKKCARLDPCRQGPH